MTLKLLSAAALFFITINSYSQSLGNFSASTVVNGENATISPSSTPSNISRMFVSATPGFGGILTGNSTNGKVTITNAKPVGNYVVKVRAFSSSGSSSTRYFNLTVKKPDCSRATFYTAAALTSGLGPNLMHLAVADFNRDGKQDLAAVNMGMNTVSIRLGNGTGGFSGSSNVLVTSHPHAIAIGDFNRDGKQDMAVTNQGNSLVAIRLGDGVGGFGNSPNVNVGNGCISIAVGDFNEDGKPDFVTGNINSHTASVRFGDGLGNFSGNLEVSVGAYPSSIALADFNSDNHQDIVTANGSNSISIRYGDGFGNFPDSLELSAGANPNGIAVGDFNNDGKNDIACANYIGNSVSVWLGDGAGGFNGYTEIPVGSNPYYVAVGNFNGDDFQDFATANYLGNSVSIRLGDGSGTFSSIPDIMVGSYPVSIGVGDFNNDKRQDFAVSNYNDNAISIKIGNPGNPPPNAISSNSPVCEGEDIHLVQLYPSPLNSYAWTGPNGYTGPYESPIIQLADSSHAGTYSVIASDNSNCISSATTSVVVLDRPEATLNLPVDTICYGNSILQLSGGYPLNGTFSGPGVINDNHFNPDLTGPGTFILVFTYTSANGCSDTAEGRITVLSCTETSELDGFDQIKVFPNPVENEFQILIAEAGTEYVARIISMDGKFLRQWNLTQRENQIVAMDEFADGIYFLQLMTGKKTSIFKIVKT